MAFSISNNIPDEIWADILSYVSPPDLNATALVRTLNFESERLIWRHIHLSRRNISSFLSNLVDNPRRDTLARHVRCITIVSKHPLRHRAEAEAILRLQTVIQENHMPNLRSIDCELQRLTRWRSIAQSLQIAASLMECLTLKQLMSTDTEFLFGAVECAEYGAPPKHWIPEMAFLFATKPYLEKLAVGMDYEPSNTPHFAFPHLREFAGPLSLLRAVIRDDQPLQSVEIYDTLLTLKDVYNLDILADLHIRKLFIRVFAVTAEFLEAIGDCCPRLEELVVEQYCPNRESPLSTLTCPAWMDALRSFPAPLKSISMYSCLWPEFPRPSITADSIPATIDTHTLLDPMVSAWKKARPSLVLLLFSWEASPPYLSEGYMGLDSVVAFRQRCIWDDNEASQSTKEGETWCIQSCLKRWPIKRE